MVQQYCPVLSDQYRGTSPRKLIAGTQYVFSASEVPPSYPIPQHLEMSFLPTPPRKIFFCCLEAPTSTGGETCLCDFQNVYEQMEPTIRAEFEEKGVRRLLRFVLELRRSYISISIPLTHYHSHTLICVRNKLFSLQR